MALPPIKLFCPDEGRRFAGFPLLRNSQPGASLISLISQAFEAMPGFLLPKKWSLNEIH